MFSFFTTKKFSKIYPVTDQISDAWKTCTNPKVKNQNDKNKAVKFLIGKFHLYSKQPSEVIMNKLRILIDLWQCQSDRNTIPSVLCLPDEIDRATQKLVETFRNKSIILIDNINDLGFGGIKDEQMDDFCTNAWRDLREIKQLEKILLFHISLINILYGLKKDPISNKLREEMNRELEQPNLTNSDKKIIHGIYAEKVQHMSIYERSANYKLMNEPRGGTANRP